MTFDEFIGIRYQDGGDAEHSASVEIQPHHCNPTGNINGAVFLSMADNLSTGCAGRAYAEKFGEDRFMVGVDVHAVMLANQLGGTVRAVSRAVRVGRRITVVRTEVRGEADRLLADVTTTHVPT